MNGIVKALPLPAVALLAAAAAVVAVVAVPAVRPAPASAACLLSVTYHGAQYVGVDRMPARAVGARVGRGVIPACNDTPGSGIAGTPSRVALNRVRGVAPRLAVALRSGGRHFLMVRDPGPCEPSWRGTGLVCLRRASARLAAGPSLIAPLSARAGAVIRLTVHVRNRALRAEVVSGQESVLQRRGVDGTWQPTHHLFHPLPGEQDPPAPVPVGGEPPAVPAVGYVAGRPFPVRLPDVEPGAYRIVKRVSVTGGRQRTLAAYLTIR